MIYRSTFFFTEEPLKKTPPLHLFITHHNESYVKEATCNLFIKFLQETSNPHAAFVQEVKESSQEEANLFAQAGQNYAIIS